MSPLPRQALRSRGDRDGQFAYLAQHFAGTEGVTLPGETPTRGFGSDALRVGGSIFAMYVRGNLVVKLPRHRVDALAAGVQAERFCANRGCPMKEWAVILTDNLAAWTDLAEEALAGSTGRVQRSGHDGRVTPQHQPVKVPACQASSSMQMNARRFVRRSSVGGR